MGRKIGMWMYKNGGGDKIEQKMVKKLKERGIETVTDINLRHAVAKKGHIYHGKRKVDKLDLFFSYNAGTNSISSFPTMPVNRHSTRSFYIRRLHALFRLSTPTKPSH